MKTLGSSTSVSADHIGRPSLYDSSLISHASEVIRILDALEAPSKRARFTRRLGILCVLALLGITVFLFAGKQFGFQSIEKNRLLVFIQQMTGASETLPTAQSKTLPNEAAQDSSHQTTADSGNDASVPVAPSDTEYPVSSETAVEDTAEIIGSAIGSAMPACEPQAHAKVDKPDTYFKSHKALQPVGQTKSARDLAVFPAKAVPLPSARAAGKSADKDVELIAALLSHVGRENATVRNPGSRGEMHGRPRAGTPAMMKNSSVDFNRDIVLRTSGESTNSLLKKCDALGFFEGQLCRLRICSGLWGKEAECPAGVAVERDG